jgi:hypothetical protein
LTGYFLKNQRKQVVVPFSSIRAPVDVARAQGPLDVAWQYVRSSVPADDQEDARTDLAYIVASLTHVAVDETELVSRAMDRFREHRSRIRRRA